MTLARNGQIIREDYFKDIDTPEKAYWLGLIGADGCVSKYKYYESYKFSIALQEKDGEILSLLGEVTGALAKPFKRTKEDYNRQDQVRLVVSNKEFCLNLIKQGIVPAKTLIYQFPNESQVPNHLIWHYIRGYFDGDGCIFFKQEREKQLDYCVQWTGTKSLLEGIDTRLKDVGVKSLLSKNTNDKVYTLKVSSLRDIKKVFNLMYKDASLFLRRKFNKFNELFEATPQRLFRAVHESGIVFEEYNGLRKFCRQFKLSHALVYKHSKIGGPPFKGWELGYINKEGEFQYP